MKVIHTGDIVLTGSTVHPRSRFGASLEASALQMLPLHGVYPSAFVMPRDWIWKLNKSQSMGRDGCLVVRAVRGRNPVLKVAATANSIRGSAGALSQQMAVFGSIKN